LREIRARFAVELSRFRQRSLYRLDGVGDVCFFFER
jgi:hypothetical protein